MSTSEKRHPYCRKCGWRRGGVDSWDGLRCKCGIAEPAFDWCEVCCGLGATPRDIGTEPCRNCGGSGLVSPLSRAAPRQAADTPRGEPPVGES